MKVGDGQHDQNYDGTADIRTASLDTYFTVDAKAILVEGSSMGLLPVTK